MKSFIIVMALSVSLLVGCGQGGLEGPAGAAGVPATNSSNVNPGIQALVNQENSYRLGLGQTALTPGLSCSLFTVTGGQFIQSGGSYTPTLTGLVRVATFLHTGPFDQPDTNATVGLNVLPLALRGVVRYRNLIMLRCQGKIVITDTDYYSFQLSSDDGSVLYIGGSRIIDNDGNHGVITKTGQKYLRAGVHSFRLDFAQTGGGNQALILKSADQVIPGNVWYH